MYVVIIHDQMRIVGAKGALPVRPVVGTSIIRCSLTRVAYLNSQHSAPFRYRVDGSWRVRVECIECAVCWGADDSATRRQCAAAASRRSQRLVRRILYAPLSSFLYTLSLAL